MTVLTASYARLVHTSEQWGAVKRLFLEYVVELGEDYDVAGSNLIDEIEALPAPYTGRGFVLLGYDRDDAVGCLGLKDFGGDAGEIRRMFVSPQGRGKKLGACMLSELIMQARAKGFRKLYLDSLHRFKSAHKIYYDAGFTLTDPYDPGTTQAMKESMIFMEKVL